MKSKSSGIYMIYNNITGQSYIGQSKNIFSRWNEHFLTSLTDDTDNTYIHHAMRKENISCFWFKILELCDIDELDEKEKFYINLYESTTENKNYNIAQGGGGCTIYGEDNKNSKLTNTDVFNIRESYKNLNGKRETYKLYMDKISFNTFSDVWLGKTWKGVHYDVYTKENRYLQSHNLDRITNHPRKVTDDEIIEIRLLRKNGEKLSNAYDKYPHINKNTFNDVWYYHTFKHIKIED